VCDHCGLSGGLIDCDKRDCQFQVHARCAKKMNLILSWQYMLLLKHPKGQKDLVLFFCKEHREQVLNYHTQHGSLDHYPLKDILIGWWPYNLPLVEKNLLQVDEMLETGTP